jgi:hypothetical protein
MKRIILALLAAVLTGPALAKVEPMPEHMRDKALRLQLQTPPKGAHIEHMAIGAAAISAGVTIATRNELAGAAAGCVIAAAYEEDQRRNFGRSFDNRAVLYSCVGAIITAKVAGLSIGPRSVSYSVRF